MLGNFDGADNLLAAPAPEPVGPDVADDEDIDFSTFVEARDEPVRPGSDHHDPAATVADARSLDTDFSFDLESASRENADVSTNAAVTPRGFSGLGHKEERPLRTIGRDAGRES